MTDLPIDSAPAAPERKPRSLVAEDARTKKRNAAEKRFKYYGMAAVAAGLFFLATLLVAIVSSVPCAFNRTTGTLSS